MSQTPRKPILRAAGMSSTYYSYSIAQGQLSQIFKSSVPQKKMKHYIPLSPRLRIQIQKEQKIYQEWLEQWERNQAFNRFLMLQSFIMQCHGFSKAELDQKFGNSSELVFYHVFSFFKVNCKQYCSIALQLKAIRIFLDASSGQEFAEQFVKGNGHVIIGELLTSKHLELDDQIEIISTFISLSTSYANRSALVDDKIPSTVIDTLLAIQDDQYHNLVVNLFSRIGDSSVHLSEQIMNVILPYFLVYNTNKRAIKTLSRSYRLLMLPELSNSFDIKNHLYELIILTNSTIQEVQSDTILIFAHIAEYETPMRRAFLVQALGDLLGFSKDDVTEEEYIGLQQQQNFVLRLFVDIFTKKSETAEAVFQLLPSLLPNLVRLLGNGENFSTQNYAAQCICKMIEYNPSAKVYLSNAIPEDWVKALLENPREFCVKMTQTQSDTLSTLPRSQFLIEQTSPSTKLIETTSPKKPVEPTTPKHKTTIVQRESPLKFSPKLIKVEDLF